MSTFNIADEVAKRRTFAIISHPDAGKTTLTEKLLLFGGAIQMAGAIKAKGNLRRTQSDWMKVERERGISVASSVMTFEYANKRFNLLDTPGHQDFSEDTYRTLTAVDSAVMVLDVARGIETQTLKLFEACRLRNIPITTLVNKLDRAGHEPFDILEEIEQKLALETCPVSWPIGSGRDFKGCYDILNDKIILLSKGNNAQDASDAPVYTISDPNLEHVIPKYLIDQLREDIEMVHAVYPKFDVESYLAGHLTPVYFGSAINNFGIQELLHGLATYAPCPQAQPTKKREILPKEKKVTGFIFKIQANMDPKHHDRIAFMRLSSGHFKRGLKMFHPRTKKTLNIHNPIIFMAQDRVILDDAFSGDIIGIPNHGNLRIGDALTEGEDIAFSEMPNFAPEYIQSVRTMDPLKSKHLERALLQLAEEGVARVLKRVMGAEWLVGVIGTLQFEIIADRIRTEYNINVKFEHAQLYAARWLRGDASEVKKFIDHNMTTVAHDHDNDPVFIARNSWHLQTTIEENPSLTFIKVKE